MLDHRQPFLSLSLTEAEQALADAGGSRVHARTLRRELLFGRAPTDTCAPASLIAELERRFVWVSSESVEQHASADGSEKHLVRLSDGKSVEAVRLPGKPGGTPSACISSQVGCAMACRFCASGLDKVARNLKSHELLEQLVHLRRRAPVGRLVFMGSGEPTQNLRHLATALDVLRDEASIGPKHVLVSTVGPASAIDRLTALDRRVTLALSLHSADAATRANLIPTQTRALPTELLDAADRFSAQTRRPYQVEYVLIGGINDARADAEALARLLQDRRVHVSLIRWNPVAGMPFETPPMERAREFVDVLRDAGVSTNLRRTMGGESTAACGQLRASR